MELPPQRSDFAKPAAAMSPMLLAQAAASAADPDDLCGAVLADRYRLLRILGHGGMGYVYLAEQVALGKPTAVKVLGTRWAKDVRFRDRFLVEARAASKIGHENVVEIYDYGITPNGSVFMAMELLAGEPLSELVAREGALPWPRAKRIALQVCRALHAAHDKGVLHRDIKPENCFRTKRGSNRDWIVVFDFGLAKIFGDEKDPQSSLTKVGSLFGTPEYMSPEQARGKPVDGRADIYSVGILLCELVSGQVPFAGDNVMDILTRVVTEAPPPPRALAPHAEISADLEAVILRAIEKDPSRRYQSMRELAEAIAAVATVGARASRPASVGAVATGVSVVPHIATRASTTTHLPYVIAIAALSVVVLLLSIALLVPGTRS